MTREVCEHAIPTDLHCDHCADVRALRDANEAFGKRQAWWTERMFGLEQQVERDTALLRQALEALEDGGFVKVGAHSWERRDALAIAALRARLGATP